jgi:hypothetical protein
VKQTAIAVRISTTFVENLHSNFSLRCVGQKQRRFVRKSPAFEQASSVKLAIYWSQNLEGANDIKKHKMSRPIHYTAQFLKAIK